MCSESCPGLLFPGLDEEGKDRKSVIYKCNLCGRKIQKLTKIKYNKINHHDFCNNFTISDSKKDNQITLNISFGELTQMELLLNKFDFVIYKNNELNKINNISIDQKYIPDINIKHNLSNNPFCLANKILEKKRIKPDKQVEIEKKAKELIASFKKEITDNIFGEEPILKDNIKYENLAIKFVKKYYGLIHILNLDNDKAKSYVSYYDEVKT